MAGWEVFASLIGGRPEPWLTPVPGLALAALPPTDDDFTSTMPPIGGDIDGVAVGIVYRDAGGRQSTRTIRCSAAHRAAGGGPVYLKAWCLQRDDWRTFRVDRIEEVYDYTTGEVIGPGGAFFGPLLGIDPLGTRGSVPVSEASLRRTFADGAKVLAFIAISDGRLHDKELAVIVDFAAARLRSAEPGIDRPERVARLWIGNHVPTRQTALAGLRAVFLDDPYAADVAGRMIDIMLADGEVADAEIEAAWAMVKGMERAEARQRKAAP